jgi:glutathione S-transferase
MANLTFYTNPMSRGQIARWMLEEVGEPYEQVLLEYGGSMKAPDYLAINPMGKVPAIRHGEVVVTEGAAICAYLADAFPEKGLGARPRRSAARSLLPVALFRRRAGRDRGHQHLPEVGADARAEHDGRLWQLRQGAGRAAGSGCAGSPLFARRAASPRWTCTLVRRSRGGSASGQWRSGLAFEDYVARITDRPAYRKAKEIDAALMPKREVHPA